MKLRKSMLFAAILITSQWSAEAAEIQFHSDVAVGRGIVRLGDVAEVLTSDANEARLLEGIALVPAPAADEPKLLKRQEVQQLLQLSGVVLREHHFSGAEVTKIRVGGSTASQHRPAVQEASAVQQVPFNEKIAAAKPVVNASPEARVGQAIVAHLNVVAEMPAEWQAEVAMSPRVAQALVEQPIVRVEGGISPWLGRQQFMLLIGNEAAPTRLPVEAEISGTALAVTVVRTIERETLIGAEDVQLQTVTLKRGVPVVLDPNQIVGREAARTLNAGQVVTSDMVRTVRLVRRGEEIQVFSIAAGLQISEPGKAISDGSHGDTIQVEFVDRRKMSVRVTGLRRAEVYAMQTSRSQVQPAAHSSRLPSQPGTQTKFPQGAFQDTGNPLDVAIEGNGFFEVQDSLTDQCYYTRAGKFSLNANNQLVIGGARAGRLLVPNITVPTDCSGISISPDGRVLAQFPRQAQLQQLGQVNLVHFPNADGLLAVGGDLYSATTASGQPVMNNPGQQGVGILRQGYLEVSNIANHAPKAIR